MPGNRTPVQRTNGPASQNVLLGGDWMSTKSAMPQKRSTRTDALSQNDKRIPHNGAGRSSVMALSYRL